MLQAEDGIRDESVLTGVQTCALPILMKVLGLFGITPKAKYKSYKGDMNGTVKNKLLHKEVDEENHKTSYVRDFSTTTVNE